MIRKIWHIIRHDKFHTRAITKRQILDPLCGFQRVFDFWQFATTTTEENFGRQWFTSSQLTQT
ncbi:MAG: hypothetical protein PHO48_05305, partial [Candidatus Gracilibacteria bacterium]|nr:hypothetical protein [Candidatus Gracilibacteria bacterium]